MLDGKQLTISEAHKLLKDKQVSSVELTKAYIERTEKLEPQIKAVVTLTADLALQQAQKADKMISAGNCTPLTGIPMMVKDNICTKDIKTTCSSKMLENFVPPYSATVIEKLEAQGMVMLAKTNMDEFAMGSSTEKSAFHLTHNPWGLNRVPGGSSGGSAAAVAAGEAVYTLGSDTGGSIRQPAGFCGVTGLKPTYGRVSRYGLAAFASSLDQIGSLTRNVTDAAHVLNAIAGFDDNDSTSSAIDVPDYTKCLTGDIKGLRIGIPQEYFTDELESDVAAAVKTSAAKLEAMGAIIDWDLSMPNTRYALDVYRIISSAEASANLACYDGVKYGFSYQDTDDMWEVIEKSRGMGFGSEVKMRIMLGTYLLSAGQYEKYYLKAQKVRTLICEDFAKAFAKYDLLITPTTPTVPFKIGEKSEDPAKMAFADILTVPVNLAGVPAISVPCGFVGGLPVGLQIIGKQFDEETVLKTAYAYEQATDWHQQRPNI
ncbi:MAG: Asp-tRNA(Asn)/Glu-tRNA(Gln) amidotransferase subunit GatA [Dehalococcoidales bacterium]